MHCYHCITCMSLKVHTSCAVFELSKSTKMTQRMVEMCGTAILVINLGKLKRHMLMSRAQSWHLTMTFHLVPLDSY